MGEQDRDTSLRRGEDATGGEVLLVAAAGGDWYAGGLEPGGAVGPATTDGGGDEREESAGKKGCELAESVKAGKMFDLPLFFADAGGAYSLSLMQNWATFSAMLLMSSVPESLQMEELGAWLQESHASCSGTAGMQGRKT